MLRVERLEKILEIVDEKGVVTVDELMDRLGASRSTIRRDLEQMDMGGKLKKTHGGAVRMDKPIVAELPLAVRQQMQTGEKARIGKYAADMVQNGDTIAICAGTTTFHMAAGLADKKDVTVLTNDIGHCGSDCRAGGMPSDCGGRNAEGRLYDAGGDVCGEYAERTPRRHGVHVLRCGRSGGGISGL